MTNPKIISTWEELAECVSDTYVIKVDDGSAWLIRKDYLEHDDDYRAPDGNSYYINNHYLTTHTFYKSQYIESTKILQQCGFDVILTPWDM